MKGFSERFEKMVSWFDSSNPSYPYDSYIEPEKTMTTPVIEIRNWEYDPRELVRNNFTVCLFFNGAVIVSHYPPLIGEKKPQRIMLERGLFPLTPNQLTYNTLFPLKVVFKVKGMDRILI